MASISFDKSLKRVKGGINGLQIFPPVA